MRAFWNLGYANLAVRVARPCSRIYLDYKKIRTIKELYAGNPTRATDKPTTKLILRIFRNIHLNIAKIDGKIYVFVSDLTLTQLQIH